MRKTIKRQIVVGFIGLVLAILLVSLFINGQFLEKYYISDKQSGMIDMYEQLDAAVKRDSLTAEETIEKLNRLVEVKNITFVIIPKNEANMITATPNRQKTEELFTQLMGYLFNQNETSGILLKKSSDYQIHSSQDVRNGEEYLEMWGHLSDGSSFILRSPIESIRESVLLSNQFLTYIMIVIVLLSSLFVWYYSKRISDPIMELATLSARMADLDFGVKYTSGGDNEIGTLGENFNVMSQKLEQTISELKRANYELQKDIEQKEKIENMRNEFLGNVSHELKTPIALIQGYAEGLKEGVSDNSESREFYCDVIMDEAHKMNQMVKSLLTLNQLEFGKQEVSFSRFDITELIRGVVQSCEILVLQKEANVRFAQESPVYVWADEFQAEQVVRNYFSNALNHLEGERVIDIRVMEKKEKGTIRISIFNTGKRIPEDDITKIWDKFYKVDKAHTREYGGHGIGLSIVKAIMESFHHEYGVQNYENGVEFWFELDAR